MILLFIVNALFFKQKTGSRSRFGLLINSFSYFASGKPKSLRFKAKKKKKLNLVRANKFIYYYFSFYNIFVKQPPFTILDDRSK
ncbi:MAG: hypothetical protein A2299_17530 [Stygiobacter sp. RIFOXYB2_FULL_37_11]|nr:MAG: hypothetical protein A2299_17530 [Stygiobacter sp. RIFOXYB2_FULL_37_11]